MSEKTKMGNMIKIMMLIFFFYSCNNKEKVTKTIESSIQELQTQKEIPVALEEIDREKVIISENLLNNFVNGNFKNVEDALNNEVKVQLNADVLNQTWTMLNQNPGEYQPTGESALSRSIGDKYIVYQKCKFGNQILYLKTVFLNEESADEIVGLFFQPNMN